MGEGSYYPQRAKPGPAHRGHCLPVLGSSVVETGRKSAHLFEVGKVVLSNKDTSRLKQISQLAFLFIVLIWRQKQFIH